jgi:8-oxo-dGTP diphosphatase
MKRSIRAAGIVIKDNKILLMYRKKDNEEYWVFPGGGVENNETVEQAVLRELKEETTIDIKIEKLLYHHILKNNDLSHDSDQYFYLCSYISGEPKLGDANEIREQDENNKFIPQWVPIDQIPNLILYPLEIRDWLTEDYKNNFTNTPKVETIKISDLRQR